MVDGALSAAALEAVRRFCLEATVWFDSKGYRVKGGGYLGAYFQHGFSTPALLQLVHALRDAHRAVRANRVHRRTARPLQLVHRRRQAAQPPRLSKVAVGHQHEADAR